ncbi:Dynein light chain 2, cytoplasmic [Schistosoma japonicum]|uniref:Dynein light chain 2, cytoplasmic n=1 Tax=Schistosoma japonicum TaxID=6182 RepID=A0A4Z2D644_SCHJA|nr:Dynein light chain 2, cytoplasmic [Schistosoma japonicum]
MNVICVHLHVILLIPQPTAFDSIEGVHMFLFHNHRYVTHETKHFIYLYLGQVAILLFKSG